MSEIPLHEVALRLASAVILAAVLGLERETQKKPAGLRTHMLVSLGGASAMLTTVALMEGTFAEIGNVRLDPMRTVAGVVGGIGFLGAGSIIQSRGSVEGMTTAASIWITGTIGVACGAGYYIIAGITAGLALFVVSVLGWVQFKAGKQD